MCEIRWAEMKSTMLITSLDTLPCLPVILETISESSDSRGSNARLSSLSVWWFWLGCWINSALGSEVTGRVHACTESNEARGINITKALTHSRKYSRETEKLVMEMGTLINKPRTTNLQKNRSNFNSFPKSELQRVGQIQKLLSPEFSDSFEDKVLQGAESFKDDLPCFSALKGELRAWKQIWKSDPSQKFPVSPAEGYKLASAPPNIRVLFQLLCILPVTTNTVERSFLTLRCLKTYLWSTMTKDWLNGLTLLHIHQDIVSAMKPEEVFNIFARKHKR
ncbi:hypothetical protein PR048_002118 [Dryococelus australis]|uniref:HAT C-terminal dimerisation domain-containing protein n=1 Tax=Dryococelus australis TaxID=614101 RepID=A0ABQ9IJ96_9NEOP|nr:hypothetical protein PR048_002118 [Dryococelus australis]